MSTPQSRAAFARQALSTVRIATADAISSMSQLGQLLGVDEFDNLIAELDAMRNQLTAMAERIK